MTTRIAIDGLGRIGRNLLRLLLTQRTAFDVVAVNDGADTGALARALRDESAGTPSSGGVRHDDGHLFIRGHAIRVLSQRDPGRLPWRDLAVDIVIITGGACVPEATARAHLDAGAGTVIVAAPTTGADGTFVMGANEAEYDPSRHRVISASSCTTACLAPVAKVFQEAFGIESGCLTTIHATPVDGAEDAVPHVDVEPPSGVESRITAARSAAGSAIGGVLPALEGRLDAVGLRAPSLRGAITHLTLTASRPIDADAVRAVYRAAAEGPLRGILRCAEDEIAAEDAPAQDGHSSVVDAGLIRVRGDQAKLSAWYDDEWGYSHRVVDLTRLVAERTAA